MHAIPTTYKGCNFRSRVEATNAALFDMWQWPWKYEPVDQAGYIPDFILDFPWSPLLVEVKSANSIQELKPHLAKIEQSGWRYDAMIIGSGPLADAAGNREELLPILGLVSQRELNGPDYAGLDLGWFWSPAEVMYCHVCKHVTIRHSEGAWNCYVCGAYEGNRHLQPYRLSQVEIDRAVAGNATQWRRMARCDNE